MSTLPPLPSEPRGPADGAIPWGALEDLALGALPAGDAARLRARIAADPAWADAFARVAAVQGALEAEGLYAFPASLAEQIAADAFAPARPGWAVTLGRAVASVALAVGAWTAWVGGTPSVAPPAGLPAWASPPVDLPGREVLAAAPDLPAGTALWAAVGACALVAGGLVLARRWGTGGLLGVGRSA